MPDPTPEPATDEMVTDIETNIAKYWNHLDRLPPPNSLSYEILQLTGRIRADALKLSRQQEEIGRIQQLLVAAYQSGHRQGWEDGPSVGEVMERIHDYLEDNGIRYTIPPPTKEQKK